MPDPDSPLHDDVVREMRSGDQEALASVFTVFRDRLKQIVSFRLDRRLAGRVSESDVLQEAYIAAVKRLHHFGESEEMSPFLWLRLITNQQLVDLHRKHFQAQQRDVRNEVSLQQRSLSAQTSIAIAANLACSMTAVSEYVVRAEQIDRLETALNKMDAVDREVIALRHFEELSNVETATVLGIETSAASKRYLRAMKRLSMTVSDFAKDDENKQL